MSEKYLAGIGVALCTTFMSAMGLALQKRAHIEIEQRKLAASRAGKSIRGKEFLPTRHRLWLLGLVFMAASALLSLAVFALVGQSVASAFAAITIVYNVFLATLFLHEKFRLFDVGVACVMIVGTVLTVVFGSRGTSNSGFQTLDDIISIFSRPAAIAGFVTFGCLVVTLGFYLRMVDKQQAAGDVSKRGAQYRLTLFFRCFTAALFSGFVGTFSKTVVSVFSAAVNNGARANLARWETWIFVLLLPTSLVFQVTFLNSALKRFDATEAVPLYQSLIVTCGVLFGWTIYNEAAGKSVGDIIGFLCGVLTIIAGILSLLAEKRTAPPVVNGLDAIKTLASAHATVATTTLRRAHSAPGSLLDLRAHPNPACSQYESLTVLVPVFRATGTAVRASYILDKGTSKPVTPSFLIRKPAIEDNEHTAAVPVGDRRRLVPQLFVNVLIPACASIQSERAQDAKTRITRSVAGVAELVSDLATNAVSDAESDLFEPWNVKQLPLLLGNPAMDEARDSQITNAGAVARLKALRQSLRDVAARPVMPEDGGVTAADGGQPASQRSQTFSPSMRTTPRRQTGHRLVSSRSLPPVVQTRPPVSRPTVPIRMKTAAPTVPPAAQPQVTLPVRRWPWVSRRAHGPSAQNTGDDAGVHTADSLQVPATIVLPLTVVQSMPFDAALLTTCVRARQLRQQATQPSLIESLLTGRQRRSSHTGHVGSPVSVGAPAAVVSPSATVLRVEPATPRVGAGLDVTVTPSHAAPVRLAPAPV